MRWVALFLIALGIAFTAREYKKLNSIEYFSEYKEDDDGIIALAYYGGL